MRTLTEIANENGTDKGTVHNQRHGYTKEYELRFEPYRDKPIRVLEIGVKAGASIKTWLEYFINMELLVGVDINEYCRSWEQGVTRIEIGDQADPNFLKMLVDKYGKFDIIIDDGGHHMHQMQISFNYLWPMVNPGGIYVIEDLQVCRKLDFCTKSKYTTVQFLNAINSVLSGTASEHASEFIKESDVDLRSTLASHTVVYDYNGHGVEKVAFLYKK